MKYPLERVVSAALVAVDDNSGEYVSAKRAEETGLDSTKTLVTSILKHDGVLDTTTKTIDRRLEDAR